MICAAKAREVFTTTWSLDRVVLKFRRILTEDLKIFISTKKAADMQQPNYPNLQW